MPEEEVKNQDTTTTDPFATKENLTESGGSFASTSTETTTAKVFNQDTANKVKSYLDGLDEKDTLVGAISQKLRDEGYDPVKMKAEKDKEVALANARKKAGLLADSFRLLSDMFTTAGKGRVFERNNKDFYTAQEQKEKDAQTKYDTDRRAYVQATLDALKYDKQYRDNFIKDLATEGKTTTTNNTTSTTYKDKAEREAELAQKKAELEQTKAYTSKLWQSYKDTKDDGYWTLQHTNIVGSDGKGHMQDFKIKKTDFEQKAPVVAKLMLTDELNGGDVITKIAKNEHVSKDVVIAALQSIAPTTETDELGNTSVVIPKESKMRALEYITKYWAISPTIGRVFVPGLKEATSSSNETSTGDIYTLNQGK